MYTERTDGGGGGQQRNDVHTDGTYGGKGQTAEKGCTQREKEGGMTEIEDRQGAHTTDNHVQGERHTHRQ